MAVTDCEMEEHVTLSKKLAPLTFWPTPSTEQLPPLTDVVESLLALSAIALPTQIYWSHEIAPAEGPPEREGGAGSTASLSVSPEQDLNSLLCRPFPTLTTDSVLSDDLASGSQGSVDHTP